jgi:hypothetical protein
MKIITMLDVYKSQVKEIQTDISGGLIPGSPSIAEKIFHDYLRDAYEDYKRFHVNILNTKFYKFKKNFTNHTEICMWCNLHAVIRDLGKDNKNLECMDFKNPDAPDCFDCLYRTIWYKRLI